MSVVFLTNSLLPTVQDLGRDGYRRFGINPNGAMDRAAARLLNLLLGNDEGDAVVEMHFPAPKILFEEDAVFALGGANFGGRVQDKPIENWRPILAQKGDVLSFTGKIFGNRIYLAIRGGFEIHSWLASASTNLKARIGGFDGRPLQKGDRLLFAQNSQNEVRGTVNQGERTNYRISRNLVPPYSSFPIVRVLAGAEFEKLTDDSRSIFQTQNFVLRHESDRMGFRLSGESLDLKESFELISSAVSFGTIQLLPDGQLIILMADHQTAGGYPRIAHIITRDLPLAAQLGAGDKINFALVSLEEAEDLSMEFERDLNLLRTAVKFQNNF